MADTYDVIVIGSGPGGYVAAIRAAQLGLKTACVEKEKALGGTCLNVGCIPSKCLLQSTELYAKIAHKGASHGILAQPSIDFAQMMKRKDGVVSGFNQGIEALFQKNKVSRLTGEATFTSSHTIQIGEQELRANHFILATGSVPTPLPFLPFDETQILSSTGALSLTRIPNKMVVIGAGIIGVELGSVYKRLGSEVHVVEFLDRICPTLDQTLSQALQKILMQQGISFQLSTKVVGAEQSSQGVTLALENQESLTADVVLVAVGRSPYTHNLGLEPIGITPGARGFLSVDTHFRTSQPHIYAIGDLIDGPMLAHKASEEGYAVAEMIAGLQPHIDYIAIPNVVYTEPEVASVGLTEQEAKERGLIIKKSQFPFMANSRARCAGEDEGFVKMIAHADTGTLLGVHILGAHAGELIAPAALALKSKMTVQAFAETCFAHPTLSEALKESALSLVAQPIHR